MCCAQRHILVGILLKIQSLLPYTKQPNSWIISRIDSAQEAKNHGDLVTRKYESNKQQIWGF